MKTRYLNELTKEELIKVLHYNEKLQNEVFDDMVESEMFWIGEQLDYIRKCLSNWSIGLDSHNYIKVNNTAGFIDGMIQMDKNIPLFTDEQAQFLQQVAEAWDVLSTTDLTEEDYEVLEEEFDRQLDKLIEMTVSAFTSRLNGCYDKQAREEYFKEFYVSERMDMDNMYVNEKYELFEDISYTKSYKK